MASSSPNRGIALSREVIILLPVQSSNGELERLKSVIKEDLCAIVAQHGYMIRETDGIVYVELRSRQKMSAAKRRVEEALSNTANDIRIGTREVYPRNHAPENSQSLQP